MTKDELNGATGYKLRMVFGKWWLELFKPIGEDKWKNVGSYGPLPWAEVNEGKADVEAHGLFDIERELGSRGK